MNFKENNLKRKGIILAGGNGTRLFPITKAISKQLLPVYNKPMIYYSLSVHLLSGINEILIISQSEFLPYYKKLLGDGSHLGVKIVYLPQDVPRGIGEAFIIGEDFIDESPVSLILGDNIFYSASLSNLLEKANNSNKPHIFCSTVINPRDFGVLEIDKNGKAKKITEKPSFPKSNLAVTGLYFYNNDVIKIAKSQKKSKRGELEISDINQYYLSNNSLNYSILPRGALWLDTGTFENLHQCSNIIYSIEKNTNVLIGSIEEISLKKKLISKKQFIKNIENYPDNEYSDYLRSLVNEKNRNKN